jgi:N-acylneuraminate cytidylyltransferase
MTDDDGRRVLGLIPARGGSKGVPGKNIRRLGGRPLLAWTVEAALAATGLSTVVVSTDDGDIADAALAAGAEVPFLREPELATDTTPTMPVVLDALDRLEADGRTFDAVCLLQPTTPFRPASLVDRAIQRFFAHDADSVVSVLQIPFDHHPDWALLHDEHGVAHWATGGSEPPPRRQELRPAYHREGSVYVTRTSVLRGGSLYGTRLLTVDVEGPTVNIDTLDDWDRAEQMAAERQS